MALPREPRQKMINMMYLVLTALLALNVSSEILNAFHTVNNSLASSVNTVNASTNTIFESLTDKTQEPETMEKAKIWHPKAAQVMAVTAEMDAYIMGLKNQILTAADFNKETGSYKDDNLDIATRIMVEGKEGKNLKARLEKFRTDLLAIDPAIAAEFKTSLPIDLGMPKTKNKGNNTWEAAYFRMVPTVAAITILSKFQNDVKTSENKVVAFCHEQVGKVEVRFDKFAAIVGQSSNYLMPGQELEIKAGVGAFSKAALPSITIGGKTMTVNDSGYVRFTQTVSTMGQGSIPVHIEYKDQEGKPQVIDTKVSYTVGQANASIALTKMNVLYIGVDNPIQISASGGGDDKVRAEISGGGGSITKLGGGNYVAKVNSITDEALISVFVDGKLAGRSVFRVRTIPDAVATVGGYASGDRVNAGAFKAQTGVGAYVKDFPFELKYTVQSFTVVADDPNTGDLQEINCTGNLWSAQAKAAINKLVPGSLITIENIRAMGPDGRTRKLPALLYNIQ